MHWEFVIPGYLIVFGGIGAYTWTVLSRARSAAARVPEDRRTFLD